MGSYYDPADRVMFNGRIDSDENAPVKTIVIGVYCEAGAKSMNFSSFFQRHLSLLKTKR